MLNLALLVLLIASTATCFNMKQAESQLQANNNVLMESLEEAEAEDLGAQVQEHNDNSGASVLQGQMTGDAQYRMNDVEKLMAFLLQMELEQQVNVQTSAGAKARKFFSTTGSKIRGFFGRVKNVFRPNNPLELLSALIQEYED